MVPERIKWIICLTVILLFSVYITNIVRSFFQEPEDISIILKNISEGTKSVNDLALNASEFTYSSIEWKTFDKHCTTACFITPYPFIQIWSYKYAPYILKSKIGSCGEHAHLLTYLLRKLEINTTNVLILYNTGSNHIFNEVWNNGEVTIFDSSNKPIIENRSDEMYPNRQIMYAERVFSDGSHEDITKLYAGESYGRINLSVTLFGKPYADKKIKVHSANSTLINFTTGNDGSVVIGLGGNTSYEVITNVWLWKPFAMNITGGEFNNRKIELEWHKKMIVNILLLFLLIVVSQVLIFFVIIPCWQRIKKEYNSKNR
jgi:hypothetical protein